jgi:hypothetical protein
MEAVTGGLAGWLAEGLEEGCGEYVGRVLCGRWFADLLVDGLELAGAGVGFTGRAGAAANGDADGWTAAGGGVRLFSVSVTAPVGAGNVTP